MKTRYLLFKRNKRLHIVDSETDESVYTPPEFLRNKIRNREELQKVVDTFNQVDEYSIKAIIDFESSYGK